LKELNSIINDNSNRTNSLIHYFICRFVLYYPSKILLKLQKSKRKKCIPENANNNASINIKIQILAQENPILLYNSKNYGQEILHYYNSDIIPFNPFFFLIKDLSFIDRRQIEEVFTHLKDKKAKVKNLLCEEILSFFKKDFSICSSNLFFTNLKAFYKEIFDSGLLENCSTLKNSLAEILYKLMKNKSYQSLKISTKIDRAMFIYELDIFSLKEYFCYQLFKVMINDYKHFSNNSKLLYI